MGAALAGAASAAPAASTMTTVRLDGAPQVATFADEHLWVLVADTNAPALVEVNPSTAQPTGRRLALPAGTVPHPFGLGSRTVLGPQRVRPSLALAGGDLFLPAGDEIVQIDPATSREVRRIPFAASYVASGPAGLWATGGPDFQRRADGRLEVRWRLARVDPASGTFEERLIGPGLDGLAPVELAVTEKDLWVVFPAVERRLVRVDPATGSVSGPGGVGGAWVTFATADTLYGTSRYGDVLVGRRGDAVSTFDMGLTDGTHGVYWRDVAAGPADSLWAVTYRGPGTPGVLVQRPLDGAAPTRRYEVGSDPVDLVPAPRAVWVLDAEAATLTKVPALRQAATPGGLVRLTAGQLRIDQRISQAAIRRLNALEAMIAGVPAPEVTDTRPRPVALSAGQLRINQRISQIAVWRANSLAARLDGDAPPPRPARDGSPIELSAAQLRISQRIAQAAVRRANELEARVPALPVPRPGFGPDRVIGTAVDSRRFRVSDVVKGSAVEGATLTMVALPNAPFASKGDTILADGLIAGGVFYAFSLSVEPADAA